MIISIAVLVALVAGYFYLPSILGDSVLPLKYPDLIKKWSKAYNEDPYRIAALLETESGFNPLAQSPVGALGIGQVMPPTGRTIAQGVGMTDFTTSKLFDPDIGIQFATWQVHVLMQKYNGNEVAALAAYNAGTGNADKWLRSGLLQSQSSNSYANRVMNYEAAYHKLYQSQLDLSAPVVAPTPIVMTVTNTQTRNVIWGQALKNLVSVFYGTGNNQ